MFHLFVSILFHFICSHIVLSPLSGRSVGRQVMLRFVGPLRGIVGLRHSWLFIGIILLFVAILIAIGPRFQAWISSEIHSS